MRRTFFLLLFLQLVLIACTNSESASSDENIPEEIDPVISEPRDSLLQDSLMRDSLIKDSLHKDSLLKDSLVRADSLARIDSLFKARELLLIKAKDLTVELGTNSPEARVNERPAMMVKFTYDFYLSKHEITCGEFNVLMKPAAGLALECAAEKHPAVNLTYYDAVLFANERSKKEGFDTAYTYLAKSFDSEKHCTNLEGFVYHPEVESYHLPTEAEWMLAAKTNWHVKKSWTADNSEYKLHPVCSMSDEDDLCDMMGNALEWVNDWFGNFRDTLVMNYVGSPDGGALAQRVVKGGSFRNQASSISMYSRGDIYSVTSSTRGDYVGFRLAFGRIPDALWMGNSGRTASSRIIPLANSSSIYAHTNTYKAKLAFRNDVTGNLAFIDYSNGTLSVVEIVDSIDVFHPDISPDGNHVAFSTMYEGLEGKSALYVRDLNEEGSNLVKLDVESAAIPRWRVLETGDTAIVYVTHAGNNKDDAAFRSTSTWQVIFANGKFGIPQKLFDGAFHGGISADGRLAVSGARLLRARVSDHDTVWYNGEQACNVSLSKDGTNRTLFLDFGSSTGRKFAGGRYATHERLFVTDSLGNLIQSFRAPAGYTFDHTEWTGNLNLAVATLVNLNGSHRKIVLLDLQDSSFTELAEGDELWHPNMWVYSEPLVTDSSAIKVDSAGVYFTPQGSVASVILRYKMELLWKFRDTANVVILGSSRPLDAIAPLGLDPSFFALNLSNVPNMMATSDYLLTNYLFPHFKKLKYVVVALDIDLWYHSETGEYNFFSKEFENYPGFVYDKNHDFWKDSVPDELARLTEESLGLEVYRERFMEPRGYNYEPSGNWTTAPSVDNDSMWMTELSSNYYASFEHLKNILHMAEERQIFVVGIIFPQSPAYKETGSFGRYGIRRSEAPALIEELKNLEQEYPHFHFWDENKMGEHDYTDEMAFNEDHLCYLGAIQLTTRLDSLLKILDK